MSRHGGELDQERWLEDDRMTRVQVEALVTTETSHA